MRVSSLRYPLFALVLVMMSLGGWAALQRAGWVLPTIRPSLIGIHGALMIGGVFGVLIALERAVAISSLLRQPRHWFSRAAVRGDRRYPTDPRWCIYRRPRQHHRS